MTFIVATQSNWFLIGWIAWLLGNVMNWIYEFLNWVGIPNIGLAIIIFTIVIKALMIPMSIKQQKSARLQSIMMPEIQAIQAKYKGVTDQAALYQQQQETKEVYQKYGTSATGGCLQLLIQMPILFALYQVIYKLPGYIGKLKDMYGVVADKFRSLGSFGTLVQNEELLTLAKNNSLTKNPAELLTDAAQGRNYTIDMLYNFDKTEWTKFHEIVNDPGVQEAYTQVQPQIERVNTFLGISLAASPWQQITQDGIWWAVFIPILAGLFQFLSTLAMKTTNPQQKDDQNPMGGTMKIMNYMFPIMSVVFCFMFSAGIGIYWVASSGVQLVIQLFVNAYMNKVDINEMVQKNVEKANVKRIKKGQKPIKATNVLQNVRNLEEQKAADEAAKLALKQEAEKSSSYYESHSTFKKGSLAEKAGMVQQYEEKEKQRKAGKL
ncbi:MAG: membrane protein insertase YidC [Lachnospiraceae bacterium]|jgi:YidC/Oxa1 family membrane protein insertase|nr:membrane protein insertase YidC [Lachnospiraceae bacterium]MBR5340243.1 membrane protein insertase YidC [Lachnospiraceae bacterium]